MLTTNKSSSRNKKIKKTGRSPSKNIPGDTNTIILRSDKLTPADFSETFDDRFIRFSPQQKTIV